MTPLTIRVSEIFGPTLQGEGAMIGKPTLFIRTGGCDFRCSWCDSLYAVDSAYRANWHKMSVDSILSQCLKLMPPPFWITLSGGNPAIQPLEPLIDEGNKLGYRFAMETQGSVHQPWFQSLDHLVLSPKPPSSDMAFDEIALRQCLNVAPANTIIKVVIFDENDLEWAYNLYATFKDYPWYLQPGNPDLKGEVDKSALLQRLDWLGQQCLTLGWDDVTILPQLHVLIWDNERGR